MAYQFETVKLDKGMYSEAGRSFTKVLEKCDPSEQYKGTPLEHLDAFQRQLKRFDIKVKGRTPMWCPNSLPAGNRRCFSQNMWPGRCDREWRRTIFCP